MHRVFIAHAIPEERNALRVLQEDLQMDVVGEAADWSTTLAQAPALRTEILLLDCDLLPGAPSAAVEELRNAYSDALVIVLISRLDARQQAALSVGADAFISREDMPERVVENLRSAAALLEI